MRNIDRNKICLHCGKTFYCRRGVGIKKWNTMQFCSLQCYYSHGNVGRKRQGQYIPCSICGKTKYYSQSTLDAKKYYCSQACKQKGQIKEITKKATPKICKLCGKEFVQKGNGTNQQFCGRTCASKAIDHGYFTGEGNPCWKGGITPKNKAARQTLEYKLWRNSVFERDEWTCGVCGKRGNGTLHAHHIKLFSDNKGFRTALDNGITLCKQCHIQAHKNKNTVVGFVNAITD